MFDAGKLQKYRRWAIYGISAIIPLTVMWFGILFGLDPMPATVLGFTSAIISVFLSNIISVNALTKAREDAKLLCMTFDSRGSLYLYTAELDKTKPLINLPDFNKKFFYSRNIIQRLVFALNPPQVKIDENQETGDLTVKIPKDDRYNSSFAFEGVQVILYNRNINNILTKDYLRQREEGMFLENQLNVTNMELDRLVNLTEQYTQTFIQKFFKKDTAQNMLIILIIIIIILVGFFVVKPAIEPLISGTAQNLGQATVPVKPIG
jgi:hypothetical protein